MHVEKCTSKVLIASAGYLKNILRFTVQISGFREKSFVITSDFGVHCNRLRFCKFNVAKCIYFSTAIEKNCVTKSNLIQNCRLRLQVL